MMDYYLPDLHYLGRKQNNKTGDGIKMAVWAGGQIEPIAHTQDAATILTLARVPCATCPSWL